MQIEISEISQALTADRNYADGRRLVLNGRLHWAGRHARRSFVSYYEQARLSSPVWYVCFSMLTKSL